MNAEKKICQNCKAQFILESDDLTFLEKLHQPLPQRCPDCLLQQRLSFRNERTFYKHPCNAPGHTESVVSTYSTDKALTVYDQAYWLSDSWDATEYGQDYDFSRPFFAQLEELFRRVPVQALMNINAVNSEYCNITTDNKNCYLVFGGDFNENCSYSTFNLYSRDSMELYFVNKCELCYEVLDSDACYKLFFSRYCGNCSESAFLYNCTNCSNCFGCVNLKSKSYCWFNEQLSKEEYEQRRKEVDLGDYRQAEEWEKKFAEFLVTQPHRFAQILHATNSTGDNIIDSKNCTDCFDVVGPAEDLHHIAIGGWGLKDSRFSDHLGHKSELVYDGVAVFSGCNKVFHSFIIGSSQDISYSYWCRSSRNLFGCAGLKSKSYCILNKQYSKEEYEALLPRIIAHMQSMPYQDPNGQSYSFGDFLPPSLSFFGYNETVAQEYFPLTKDQATQEHRAWKDPEEKHYAITKKSNELPISIHNVSDEILEQVIQCEHEGKCSESCTTAFKIVPSELQFYRRLNLPLPRLCPSCRHYQRFRSRNPLKLWRRACQCAGASSENGIYKNTAAHVHAESHCAQSFETSYAPDCPEIVYCEACYQDEVA